MSLKAKLVIGAALTLLVGTAWLAVPAKVVATPPNQGPAHSKGELPPTEYGRSMPVILGARTQLATSGAVQVRVADVDVAIRKLKEGVAAAGGQTLTLEYERPEPHKGWGLANVQVDAAGLQALAAQVRGLGDVERESLFVEDLGPPIADLEARLAETKSGTKLASLTWPNRNGMQQRLTHDLEGLHARLAVAPLRVTFREPKGPGKPLAIESRTPPTALERAWDEGLVILLQVSARILYAGLVTAPVYLGLLGGWLIFRKLRRKPAVP